MTPTTIEVTCTPEPDGGAWTCTAQLADARGRGEHQVRVTRGDLDRYAPGAAEPDDLIRRSFEFLLEREPRSSILASFELREIGRYFPEYEATIRA